MMKRIYLSMMLAITMLGSGAAFAAPAAACTDTMFAIPAWYRGLQDGNCNIKAPDNTDTGARNFALKIGLNIIQALMVIVAYVTIFFIIKGGFDYMTSAGSSDGMANARRTITNAVIGLVIAILAASIVNAVAGVIK